MPRLLRFAAPLALLVALVGCDAATPGASADAKVHPILGPSAIAECSTGEFTSLMNPDFTFDVRALSGSAEVLNQSVPDDQRRATIGGVSQGTAVVRLRDKYGTVRAQRSVQVTPPQTTGGGIPICTY